MKMRFRQCTGDAIPIDVSGSRGAGDRRRDRDYRERGPCVSNR